MTTASNSASVVARARSPLLLRAGYWICSVIAVAVVVRRMLALARPTPNGPPQMAALDAVFASHAALTLAHIVPALLFVVIAPFALFSRFRHLRWPKEAIFPLGVIVGLTAFAMSSYSVGGWTERSAVFCFDSLFLFSLFAAWWFRRQGNGAGEHRWLLRAVAILLGIATTRPVMGVFFATSARDSSRRPPVLRDCFLDWFFHQHARV